MKEIKDGCCLQLGIGGLPNVVGSMIAESDLKDLGIHTEMLSTRASISITPGRSPARARTSTPTRCATPRDGNHKLYAFLHNNRCALLSVNYINDPG